jgi:hypothetical protein
MLLVVAVKVWEADREVGSGLALKSTQLNGSLAAMVVALCIAASAQN